MSNDSSELILHHYPQSPFSEKTRLILGHKRLEWRSVIIPVSAHSIRPTSTEYAETAPEKP